MPQAVGRILPSVLPLVLLSLAGCMGGLSNNGQLNKSASRVTLSADSASITQGNPVSLTAYVNPSLATGTVTFYNGSNAIGTAQIAFVGTTAMAMIDINFSSIGPQTITATYSGDDFYSSSNSNPVTIGVYSSNLASSSVALTTATTAPAYQTEVILTAAVSPSSATGSVAFYNGSTKIGNSPVNGGTASLTTSFTAGGVATLHAVYSGNYSYASSTSNTLTMNVSGPLATATSLQASAGSVAAGNSLTLTASLTPATASGTVTFYEGSNSLGTANVNAGAATLSTTFAAAGNVALKAVFNANASWETSVSNTVSVFVTGDTPDTVSLQSAPFSITIGYSATLTATISPGAATGTVSFYDGSVEIGSAPVSAGAAIFSSTFMSAGPQSLTAVYSGDTTYLSSSSSAVTLQVGNPGPTPSSTALALSEYSGYSGDFVTLTATVIPTTATGQVNFYANGTLLGGVTLSSGTATYSQIFSQSGSFQITAVYEGDPTYSSSTSAAQTLNLDTPDNTTPTYPTYPIYGTYARPAQQ